MLKQHKRFTKMPAIILVITILVFISQSCNTTEPPDGGGNGTDTTSQNFTFETFEFGDGGSSSYFNDVWVFDENNIWAVGYISADVPYNPNIIRWDGTDWKLQPFDGTSSGIYGIWAVDSTKIYFANGIVVKCEKGKYKYEDFSGVPLPDGQAVYKLWGSSEDNIWGVGPWGTVVHYDGVSWKKLEFDRQWYFYDITGDKETGIAYAVARRGFGTSSIVKLSNNLTEIVYEDSESVFTSSDFNSIEEVDKNELWISGTDIWSFNTTNNVLKKEKDLYGYFLSSLSASGRNNIYFFGGNLTSENIMTHYNGIRYTDFDPANSPDITLFGSDCIKDLAVGVGYNREKAYLIQYKRK